MSHRTKLIITAVFLVLLAIPISYVAITWRVKQPLRVRYLGLGAPEKRMLSPFDTEPVLMVPLRLDLENTAGVSIHVWNVRLYLDGTQGDTQPLTVFAESGPTTYSPFSLVEGLIPMRGSMRGQAFVTPEIARDLQAQEMFLHCERITATQGKTSAWLREAADYFQSETLYRMSLFHPDHDVTPVENANATPP